jgi:hypothetical protein
MRFGLFCVLILVGVVTVPSRALAADYPTVEVAGGYAILHDNSVSQNFPTGWFLSASGNISQVLGIVGELSGAYKTASLLGTDVNLSMHSFMAGPKFASRQGQVTPFAQLLVGAARASGGILGVSVSETDLAVQPGAGIDVNLGPNLGFRLGANYRIIKATDSSVKEFQFVAGIVYRNGR